MSYKVSAKNRKTKKRLYFKIMIQFSVKTLSKQQSRKKDSFLNTYSDSQVNWVVNKRIDLWMPMAW